MHMTRSETLALSAFFALFALALWADFTHGGFVSSMLRAILA